MEKLGGLIDRLLELRSFPVSPELMGDPDNGRTYVDDNGETIVRSLSPQWRAHMQAVDACLDDLIPALKMIVTLPAMSTHSDLTCVNKRSVEDIIGAVPLAGRKR